jgi:acyl-CoA reductase-like NAD-dependent aldehyde dehydrogenase
MSTATAPRSAPETLEIRNPYTGELVDRIAETTPDDIHRTVEAAREAADAFRFSTPFERRRLIDRIAERVDREAETLARTISREMGKTITEARNEIRRAANTLRLAGDAATFLDGEVLHCGIVEGGVDRHAVIRYVPTGVVAAITPFNYPVNLLCHKLGPALAAGNAVVVKPSPKAPLAAGMLAELCREAGAPQGLVGIVHGGAEAARTLVRARIDLLSFTGGPEAGIALKRESGLVRCLMELGGNDPLFVMPDADLDAAAATAVAHRYEIAGQSCAAVKKLYVHEAVRDRFVEILLDKVSRVVAGDPADPETHMGPVIDTAAAETVMGRVEAAERQGAIRLAGRWHGGTRFDPIVLDRVPADSELFASETFGPVLAIRSFENLATAAAEVNAGRYGLQAGIFTNDHAQIRDMSRVLQVGGLMVNEGPDFRAEHVPFGGIKQSGLGREGVRIALREMSETRVVID